MRRLSFCASLLALVFVAVPAQALGAANHPFLAAINGGYEDACGLARSGGGLYVSDYYHDAIELPGGGKIANESPGSGPCKLALDAGGNLYVNNYHHDVVKYTEPFTSGAGAVIDATEPTSLALDPTTGNLYVVHRTYVSLYEAPVHAGEAPAKTIGLDSSAEYFGAAVSAFPGAGAQPATAGDLYLADAATHTVKVFDSTGALLATMDGAATPQGGFKYLVDSEVAVDNNPTSPSYGHVYVLDSVGGIDPEHPQGVLDEFNSAGDYRGQITGFADAEPSAVAIDPATGNVYVTSGNSEGSAVFTYGPTAPARSLKVAKSGTGGGTVTASPNGIACGSACAAEYDEGKTVTVFAAPDAHSVFKGWTVTGPGAEPCPGTGTCTTLMSANREVSVEFEEPPAQETLTLAETGAGTVKSEPAGISCPGTCTEHFNLGRLVTLTATPAPHSRFAEWQGVACDESRLTTCQVTMSQAESLSAKFVPIPPQTLTATVTGSGEGTVTSSPAGIYCSSACSAGFDEGSSVTLTEITAPGSAFAGWNGACAGTAPTCSVTMSAAESVSAGFASLFAPSPPPVPAPSPSPPPSGSPPAPPAPAPAQLELGKLTVKGATATLKLRVSGPGSVTATGKRLKKAGAKASKAGALTLRLSLSKAGQRALHRARHGKLKLKVTLTFTPSGGGTPTVATKTVTFRA